MDTNATLRRLRQSLALLYAVRDVALRRLSRPLPPAAERMERDHLERFERAICEAEIRIGRLERG